MFLCLRSRSACSFSLFPSITVDQGWSGEFGTARQKVHNTQSENYFTAQTQGLCLCCSWCLARSFTQLYFSCHIFFLPFSSFSSGVPQKYIIQIFNLASLALIFKYCFGNYEHLFSLPKEDWCHLFSATLEFIFTTAKWEEANHNE